MSKIKEMYGGWKNGFICGGKPLCIENFDQTKSIIKQSGYTIIAFCNRLEISGNLLHKGELKLFNMTLFIEIPYQKLARALLKGLPKFKSWEEVKEYGFVH